MKKLLLLLLLLCSSVSAQWTNLNTPTNPPQSDNSTFDCGAFDYTNNIFVLMLYKNTGYQHWEYDVGNNTWTRQTAFTIPQPSQGLELVGMVHDQSQNTMVVLEENQTSIVLHHYNGLGWFRTIDIMPSGWPIVNKNRSSLTYYKGSLYIVAEIAGAEGWGIYENNPALFTWNQVGSPFAQGKASNIAGVNPNQFVILADNNPFNSNLSEERVFSFVFTDGLNDPHSFGDYVCPSHGEKPNPYLETVIFTKLFSYPRVNPTSVLFYHEQAEFGGWTNWFGSITSFQNQVSHTTSEMGFHTGLAGPTQGNGRVMDLMDDTFIYWIGDRAELWTFKPTSQACVHSTHDSCLPSPSRADSLTVRGIPRWGESISLDLTTSLPNGIVVFLESYDSSHWQGILTPVDTTIFGIPGCSIHCDLENTKAIKRIDEYGRASIILNAPYDPSLNGLEFYYQACVIHPKIQNSMMAGFTNMLTLTVGHGQY